VQGSCFFWGGNGHGKKREGQKKSKGASERVGGMVGDRYGDGRAERQAGRPSSQQTRKGNTTIKAHSGHRQPSNKSRGAERERGGQESAEAEKGRAHVVCLPLRSCCRPLTTLYSQMTANHRRLSGFSLRSGPLWSQLFKQPRSSVLPVNL